ncbi:MAG: hypothetical protein ACXAC2_21160, partial [Candidatus Kariarchaeaceae archaeon]
IYANRKVAWGRINKIAIFRSEWDDDVKEFLEYKLMVTISLTADVTKVTIDNIDWDYYSVANSNYAMVKVEDGLELLTDGFESLSSFPEDVASLNVRYGTAVYANNRLYVGNIWINDEVLNDRISWSPINGLAIPPSNWLTLTKGDPDQITALMFHEDWLLIGKQNALFIYDVTSFEPTEWFEVRILRGVGVLGNDQIAATPHGIFFAGNQAFYKIDRTQGVSDLTTGILSAANLALLQAGKVFYDIYNKTVMVNTSSFSFMFDLITNTWLYFTLVNSSNAYIYQKMTTTDATNGKIYIVGYDDTQAAYRLYQLFASANNHWHFQTAPIGRKNAITRFREFWIDEENVVSNSDVDILVILQDANDGTSNISPTRSDYVPLMRDGQTIQIRMDTNTDLVNVTTMAIRGFHLYMIPTARRRRTIW